MASLSRRLIHAALSVGLSLLAVAVLAFVGAGVADAEGHVRPASQELQDLPTNRPSSSGPIVVAVVLGSSGTVGSDVLAPYEVFASSPEFSVYTIAAHAAPAAVDGGPAIVPTYTFEDIRSGRARQPDVVVVPAVGAPEDAEEAPMRKWIAEQSGRGARILGVCSGSMVLAGAGLLDGHKATSHWSRLGALKRSHPQVQWVGGLRFVQDGRITTTAGVTSGIPGALKVMEELAGAVEAERVGRLLNYPGWQLAATAQIPVQSFTASDIPIGLNALIPWLRPTIGVWLFNGVGEIDVASAFEVYNASFAARAVAIGATDTVTTKHGLILLTVPERQAPSVDRLIAPGAFRDQDIDPQLRDWAASRNVPVDAFAGADGLLGFDGAIEYLAQHTDRATAVSAAKMIDYPTARLFLPAGGTSARVPGLLALGLVLAILTGSLPAVIRSAIRRRREGRGWQLP
ncbi:DJ-1/PfpI family protein [Arthrobacter sp. ok362]|uniref:DJ-1/PfpI family protein n=1 Tax=Arthrobacter sp. ok362 TaxID=1761745 RepID=UPI0008811F68|nr:DJ-1/PfpI family protein [Arthrobacter sp. ok362]SDK95413.1 DJ-1/PfpI family protein [Arthrobacter sp. ok362]